jgi:hypothetical protein
MLREHEQFILQLCSEKSDVLTGHQNFCKWIQIFYKEAFLLHLYTIFVKCRDQIFLNLSQISLKFVFCNIRDHNFVATLPGSKDAD